MGKASPVNRFGDIPAVRDLQDDGAHMRGSAVRSAALVVAALLAITLLHIFTNATSENHVLHLLYRRMYYVPILYAAFVFGRRGGFLAALGAGVPFAFHAQMSLGGLTGAHLDNLFEIIMFAAAGLLFGALRDADERRTRALRSLSERLEEAYKALEERAIELIHVQDFSQSILRSITSGVLTISSDGSIMTANPAAERMLGVSEYDMVPKHISQLFADDGGLGQDVEKVLTGRLPLALRETNLVTRAGGSVQVQASTSRMRAVGGRILGVVLTFEDISEVKSLTEQLIRADRLAAMGELTAGVAHEVRNPLGIIRASVQLLEDAECDGRRINEATLVIKQEIDRLDKVIKALLDFGRPSRPTLVATDLKSVLEDVILFTNRFAKQARVAIEADFPDDLPRVFGDPDQLKQVFLNLITNAVQAMEESGGVIAIQAREDSGFLEVRVQDSGPGIAPGDIGKVFDPFHSTRDDGTGLGLTIVHRIIDEHDGHIDVESGDGGTVFTVSLPTVAYDGGVS